ncbi:MAG: polysaccharide biosynthesis protein [Cellvibrionaceae bacterium]
MLQALLEASRPTKRFISVSYDIFALSASLYIAWALRLDTLTFQVTITDLACLGITIIVSILSFVRLGLYRAILRFMTQEATVSVMAGLLISAITLAACSFFLHGSIPRSIPIIYLLTAAILIGLPRLMVRNVVQMFFPQGDTKVLIYGAGSAGRMLADSLQQNPEFQVVAFLDDDRSFKKSRVRSLPVFPGKKAGALIEQHKCKKIFLALGSTERSTKLRVIRQLEQHPIQIQTIPPLEELTKGNANISEIRDISIEDLLGRDPVQPDSSLMNANITKKVVMVTGAGGSIGSELCRQILNNKPKSLLLFDLNEFNLYQIEQELTSVKEMHQLKTHIAPLLGSAQDKYRLKSIMQQFQVETVYHAAAYKHVPLVEQNMIQGIQNNVFGTHNCALAAHESGVSTFVLISTDKAVRSTNIMGASKRLAELATKHFASFSETKFSIVRFGNVLGSSGSVVPKFRKQIKEGGPVTVTHPDITRYFMTIPEAAQLVIQAGALGTGGETFVLEMGEPVKIADLAKEMIRLSGFTPKTDEEDGDMLITYTGLRSGEKLFEELFVIDNAIGTEHPRITQAIEGAIEHSKFNEYMESLLSYCKKSEYEKIIALLSSIPDTFTGKKTPNDHMWNVTKTPLPRLQIVPSIESK